MSEWVSEIRRDTERMEGGGRRRGRQGGEGVETEGRGRPRLGMAQTTSPAIVSRATLLLQQCSVTAARLPGLPHPYFGTNHGATSPPHIRLKQSVSPQTTPDSRTNETE